MRYDWNFGDGATGTGSRPAHSFTNSGVHDVWLTVTDDDGATHADSLIVNVLNRAPSADASANIVTAAVGESVMFDGRGSSDLDGTVVGYDWDFDDGSTGTGSVATHAFGSAGVFDVLLSVEDDDGAVSSDTVSVTVEASSTGAWSTNLGGSALDLGYAVAADGAGNIFVTGCYSSSMTVGSTTLNANGAADCFVSKFLSSGVHAWSRSVGGSSSEQINAVAVDPNGNPVVVGFFTGSLALAGNQFSALGDRDVFVAKFSGSSGSPIWARAFGSTYRDDATDVDIGSDGSIVFGGKYSGTINFGGSDLSAPYLVDSDSFLVKLSGTGGHVWSKSFTNASDDFIAGVSVGPDNAIAVAGTFNNTIDFGGGNLLAENARTDGFVAKFSAGGVYQWSRALGSAAGFDDAHDVAMGADGSVVAVGKVSAATDFGGGTRSSFAGSDAFVAKYSSSGGHVWSKILGGNDDDVAEAVTVAGNGQVIVAGAFRSGGAFFGGSTDLNASVGYDGFATKFAGGGAHIWAESFAGGTGTDRVQGVCVGAGGSTVLAGYFRDSLEFDDSLLVSSGSSDAFVGVIER